MRRINIQNVSKQFTIGHKKTDTVLARLLSLISDKTASVEQLQVLDDVSFEAQSGENIGIIGRNGSGKSTLLRVIAGIYKADTGKIETEGESVYLNGFGLGLQARLTMRENIYLIGAIMGLSQKEVASRFDAIVGFSGLQKFLDTKVFQFSSGMTTRLNFSATIHCIEHKNPEILLLDEILGGGGDIDFHASAVARMEQFLQGGSTVIMVSHSLDLVRRYCDRVIWLEKGRIKMIGPADQVVDTYIASGK